MSFQKRTEDAVCIPTDKGFEHVERCRKFVEAGIPIFVDKPMVDNIDDLNVFIDWVKHGAAILSSSCNRYAKNLIPYHKGHNHEIGQMRFIYAPQPKTWKRYGIHGLESIYPMTGPGYLTVQNTGAPAHLLCTSDGKILSVYAKRVEPQKILAMVSTDGGESWQTDLELADCVNWDCGYPATAERKDGSFLTVYYAHDSLDGPAVIKQVVWKIKES